MTGADPKNSGESINGLFANKVRVIQSLRGYRVSEDALILTWFARVAPGELVLDAGTGCGVIAFGLAMKEREATIVGLEIQEALADRAGRSRQINGLEFNVTIVRGDLRRAHIFFRPKWFDAVVSNPPYHEPGRGWVSTQEEKALSRHQLMMPIVDLFSVSRQVLRSEGRLSLIYPASELDKVRTAMKETGFKPSRMLWIHPYEAAPPGLVCLEARLIVSGHSPEESSLVLFHRPGLRTRAAEAILAGEDIVLPT
jgi:tRNA1Val (adenine37-N6)-methyltransferase